MSVKKTLGKILLSSFLFVSPLNSYSQDLNKEKEIIVLDPGHGGKDLGKKVDGVIEKDLNLEISKRIRDSLLKGNYEVYLTREGDYSVNSKRKNLDYDNSIDNKDELLARAKFAQEKNADYFFSLHFNYNNAKWLNRMEIYFYGIKSIAQLNNGQPDFNSLATCNDYVKESAILARDFENYFRERSEKEIKVSGTDLDVLFWKPAKKSLLFEFGYLSNAQFRNFIKTPEGKDYCVNLFLGFFDYLEKKDPVMLKPKFDIKLCK